MQRLGKGPLPFAREGLLSQEPSNHKRVNQKETAVFRPVPKRYFKYVLYL